MKPLLSTGERTGFSLVELLVVMSVASVELTMSAMLIHRIMHTQSQARAFLDVERSALRLSHQFRRDVHAAHEASLGDEDDEAMVTLQLAGNQTISYRRTSGSLRRQLTGGGVDVAREEFRFPSETEWTLEEKNAPRRLVLSAGYELEESLDPDSGHASPLFVIPVNCRIEACLGRDGSAPDGQE